MNNKDYLDKIAAENRALKPKGKGIFGALNIPPTLAKVLIGGAILVAIMMIVGMIVGGGDKNSERDLVDKISLRTKNMLTIISDYNKQVKSSELRSYGSSLSAVLNETNYAVNAILKETFEVKNSKPQKESTETDESAILEEMGQTLENARLNGILDRVYAREMAYRIATLIVLEQETIDKTKKSNLVDALTSSMTNLDQLHDKFDNFVAK
ncbi:hypothetical protein IK112_01130 [Candidatus Saccharibacteria bacterium]|nr:hypothetical protein [Candidatus Saccharibacteria bacterium]